jgi:hypothetical protein
MEGLRNTTLILRIAGVPASTRNEQLPNTRLDRYRHSNPLDLRLIISGLLPDIFAVTRQCVLSFLLYEAIVSDNVYNFLTPSDTVIHNFI